MNKIFVRFLNLLLKVAIKHANGNALVLQVLDPLAIHCGIGIFNSDPDFFDPGQYNPLGTREFGMAARPRGAGSNVVNKNASSSFWSRFFRSSSVYSAWSP